MENPQAIHILVTGAAGSIGVHLCRRLLQDGFRVTGLDLVDDQYAALRRDRLAVLGIQSDKGEIPVQSDLFPKFDFVRVDVGDREALSAIFARGITHVVHLAAKVGVRQSVTEPRPYLDTNVHGFFNVLELSRQYQVKHLVFASSSSVYGLAEESPFRVDQNTDRPLSFYAATKKANELFAHSFAHLHGLPVTGLRFFTVYGPWGRPDMAPYLFTRNIVDGKPIRVFNHGNLRRDFTYVGDIIEGILRILSNPPKRLETAAPYRIYNIGLGAPVDIMEFIREIESLARRKAQIVLEDHQPGDLEETFADVSGLQEDFGYTPRTGLKAGLKAYWEWFEGYYLGKE